MRNRNSGWVRCMSRAGRAAGFAAGAHVVYAGSGSGKFKVAIRRRKIAETKDERAANGKIAGGVQGMAGESQMKGMFRMALLCLMAGVATGCDRGAKPGTSAHKEEPLEIRGYRLGMSEKAALEHGDASCYSHPGGLDADRICSASTSVSGQPALLYFYFYNDSLEKLVLTILPRHGQLAEISRTFSEELETKYGKPSTDNPMTAVWSHGSGVIAINRGDGRTMTVNLVSGEYENEKDRRMKGAGRGVEV